MSRADGVPQIGPIMSDGVDFPAKRKCQFDGASCAALRFLDGFRAVWAERRAARLEAALQKIYDVQANENSDPDSMEAGLSLIHTISASALREGRIP